MEKKKYLRDCIDVYEVNARDGIMLQSSSIPVNPDEEGDAAARLLFGF